MGEIADALYTSERSVYRLLHTIERAGIRLRRTQTGRHVRYSASRADVLESFGLQGPASVHRCSICGEPRHNRRTCPDVANRTRR